MGRAIQLAGGLLTCAILAGCGDAGATGAPPPGATVGQPGPQASAMPPGASDAMKKSLQTKPKRGANAHPGEVPH
jgi:hypothetical protein